MDTTIAIAVSATDNDDSGELLTSCDDGFKSMKKKNNTEN